MPSSQRFFCTSRATVLRIAAGAVLALSLAMVIGAARPGWCAQDKPSFKATFVQLWDEHDAWTEAQWRELFASLSEIGVEELIIQWTAVAENPFYQPGAYDKELARLRAILDLADAQGLKYRLGLLHDPTWWDKIKNGPELVAVYLRRLLLEQRLVTGALLEEARSRPGFSGFYIPQEIDDKTWLGREMRALLVDYLANLRRELQTDGPGGSVSVSGFSNGHAEPLYYALFVQSILSGSGLDLFHFQDGVGAGKLDLEESRLYMEAAQRGAAAAGGSLDIVVELFEQKTLEGDFSAVPAQWGRVAEQLRNAGSVPGASISAFSIPDYMSPQAGSDSEGQ